MSNTAMGNTVEDLNEAIMNNNLQAISKRLHELYTLARREGITIITFLRIWRANAHSDICPTAAYNFIHISVYMVGHNTDEDRLFFQLCIDNNEYLEKIKR